MLSNVQSSPPTQDLECKEIVWTFVEFSLNFDTDHFQVGGKNILFKKKTDISYLINLRAVS